MASLADPDEALRSTNAKTNFQRLTRLLMRGGVALLRETFDSIHPPATLPITLSNPTVQAQLKSARLTRPEWNCLYPSAGSYGKSSDFDITLTFRLLRTICKLSPPPKGWDDQPDHKDHSREADLARVKYYRNTVYGHSKTMEITDAKFVVLWKEISEALLRIAANISNAKRDEWKKAIDKFASDPLTPDEERCVEELQLWYKQDMDVKNTLEKLDIGMEVIKEGNKKIEQRLEQLAQAVQGDGEQAHLPITLAGPVAIINVVNSVVTIIPDGTTTNVCSSAGTHRVQLLQAEVGAEGTFSTSTAPEQEQPRERVGDKQDYPSEIGIWSVISSFERSFILLFRYLINNLRVSVRHCKVGSLVITVECGSLNILEGLWNDFSSGHLNKVVQEALVTAEVLEKLGLTDVKLKTFIYEKEYEEGIQYFIDAGNAVLEKLGLTDVKLRTSRSNEEYDKEIQSLKEKAYFLEAAHERVNRETNTFKQATGRKLEELNKFITSDDLFSLRTEIRELRGSTEKELFSLRTEIRELRGSTEKELFSLQTEIRELREILERREEWHQAAGEHPKWQAHSNDGAEYLEASTGHKRPLFKRIRGLFRSKSSKQKKEKVLCEPTELGEDAEDARTGRRDARRHDSTRSQTSFDAEDAKTGWRAVIRHDSTRSQISFDAEDARTGRRDARRHDSTRSQTSFEEARTPRRYVKRHDSARSQISLEIALPSRRTYSNQSLPVNISYSLHQEESEDADELEGSILDVLDQWGLKKTRSLQAAQYNSLDSDGPPESVIKEHPSDQEQKEGCRVEFKCLVHENRKVIYQWYKDGIRLRGKNSSSLVLESVKLLDFGFYVCHVKCLDSLNNEDSNPATLDVIPRDGMRLQLLEEFFQHSLETRETVEKLLVTEAEVPGGWKQVAHKYKMKELNIRFLKGHQDAGATVLSHIIAHNPELTVYDFCKTLKEPNIRRLDIVKELWGHLSVPKE